MDWEFEQGALKVACLLHGLGRQLEHLGVTWNSGDFNYLEASTLSPRSWAGMTSGSGRPTKLPRLYVTSLRGLFAFSCNFLETWPCSSLSYLIWVLNNQGLTPRAYSPTSETMVNLSHSEETTFRSQICIERGIVLLHS